MGTEFSFWLSVNAGGGIRDGNDTEGMESPIRKETEGINSVLFWV